MSKKKVEPIIEKVEVVEEVVTTPPTIYDKYEKYITQMKAGFIRDLTYAEAVEILRYCEKQTKTQIPLNMSCGTCMLGLIKLFNNLRNG